MSYDEANDNDVYVIVTLDEDGEISSYYDGTDWTIEEERRIIFEDYTAAERALAELRQQSPNIVAFIEDEPAGYDEALKGFDLLASMLVHRSRGNS